jgi:1-acyl-sn-glycerol-3-phosphate acyltransferase
MPLPPLSEPGALSRRLASVAVGVPVTGFLLSTLLGFNAAQLLSLGIKPLSPGAFRRFNRWAADTWWGWCVSLSERINDTHVRVSGDAVPPRENALVIANHQQMSDIPFLMIWARQKERLGDLKWMVKTSLKWVPGVGWGMAFLDCVFVDRDWLADRASIERTYSHLIAARVPMWMITFPEGTRITAEKLPASQAYAREHGLAVPEHVLIPRVKGFVAAVRGLAGHATAIYDVTIGYQRGVPTLWQYIKGLAGVASLHVRRYPLADLPTDDGELARWLLQRFAEKDRLLDHFYRHGAFPSVAP